MMDESAESETTRIRQLLDELIKKDAELKQSVYTAGERLKKWQAHELALRNSNEKLQSQMENLQTRNANLSTHIKKKIGIHMTLDSELKNCEENNNLKDQQFWKDFEKETDKYRDLFTKAGTEYGTIPLKNDIQRYQAMSSNLNEKILETDNEMMNLIKVHGLIEQHTNENANCLEDWRKFQATLIEHDKSLTSSIQSAENEMRKLDKKVRQKRRGLDGVGKEGRQ